MIIVSSCLSVRKYWARCEGIAVTKMSSIWNIWSDYQYTAMNSRIQSHTLTRSSIPEIFICFWENICLPVECRSLFSKLNFLNLFSSEKKFCPQKAHISEDNNYTIIIVYLFALILDNNDFHSLPTPYFFHLVFILWLLSPRWVQKCTHLMLENGVCKNRYQRDCLIFCTARNQDETVR